MPLLTVVHVPDPFDAGGGGWGGTKPTGRGAVVGVGRVGVCGTVDGTVGFWEFVTTEVAIDGLAARDGGGVVARLATVVDEVGEIPAVVEDGRGTVVVAARARGAGSSTFVADPTERTRSSPVAAGAWRPTPVAANAPDPSSVATSTARTAMGSPVCVPLGNLRMGVLLRRPESVLSDERRRDLSALVQSEGTWARSPSTSTTSMSSTARSVFET
jgi:hypothetical protein